MSLKDLSDAEQKEASMDTATRRYLETMDRINRDHADFMIRSRRTERILFLVMVAASILPFAAIAIAILIRSLRK